MKLLLVPDSFKGTLSSPAVAAALARGLRRVLPDAELLELPAADGGEGTLEVVLSSLGGERVSAEVSDPLGRPCQATWARLPPSALGADALLEVASASGLTLLTPQQRDPTRASSRGTGELLRAALEAGARELLLGLGGSATCDAGVGIGRALGFSFLDAAGLELPPGGGALCRLDRIVPPAALPPLSLTLACDVTTPLLGEGGAAPRFAPQKGASPADVVLLSRGLERFAELARRDLGASVGSLPGGGAAGGLGAGLVALLGATLRPGADLILDLLDFEGRLQGCDLVITGEGRLDGQTAEGKLPARVAARAKAQGVPVAALAGCVAPDADFSDFVTVEACGPPGPLPTPADAALRVEAAAARLAQRLLA